MAFWNKGSEEEKAVRLALQQEQAQSLAALGAGSIPLQAQRRLAAQVGKTDFFTSDLSSNEHLLVRQADFDPIGQVMGSSFYKVALAGYGNFVRATGESAFVTQAQLAARGLALSRLKQEAALLGAQGVVGVRLKAGNYDWSSNLIEFTAIGTAVRSRDQAGAASEDPFTSALSGQDFWKLFRAGFQPKEVAYGICSYYIHSDTSTRSVLTSIWGGIANQEVAQYTTGFQTARRLAMTRFSQEVSRAQAQGAVGVRIDWDVEDIEYEVNDRTYHDLLVNFAATGTAIVSRRDAPAPSPTLTFFNLKDRGSFQLTPSEE